METTGYSIYEKIFSQRDEKETEFEETLPEYLPGIARIVSAKAIPVVRYERTDGGTLSVGVRTVYKILFVSDYKKQLKCASFVKDYDFSFALPAGEFPRDSITDTDSVISFVSAEALGQRKIAMRSVLAVNASVYAPLFEETFSLPEDENIVRLERSFPTVVMSKKNEDELRISKELTLSQDMPSITEIVDAHANFCVCEVKVGEGRAEASGNIVFHALYRTEDGSYVSLLQDIPFTATLSGEGLTPDCSVSVSITPTSLSADSTADSYGEERNISVGISADITTFRYCEEKASIYEDVFCRNFECSVEVKQYPTKKIAGVLEEKFSVDENTGISSKDVTGIIESNASINQVSTEYMDGKAVVSAKVAVTVLGTNEKGEISNISGAFPVKLVFSDVPPRLSDSIFFDTDVGVCGIDCTISGGEIKCRLSLCVRSIITESARISGVSDVEIDESAETAARGNEYIIYYPSQSDTLWSVAKKYRVSPDSIAKANKITGETLAKRTVVIPAES